MPSPPPLPPGPDLDSRPDVPTPYRFGPSDPTPYYPKRCQKCARREDLSGLFETRYCGPTQRLMFPYDDTQTHTIGDGTEHLVFTCPRCRHMTSAPCLDAAKEKP